MTQTEKGNTMSNHVFSLAPSLNAPRSTFKRPFQLKTTIDVDYLYPIYCDEVLPGDTVKFKFSLFGRLSTPIVPIMDRLYLDTFFFAVPIRLIDKNWEKLQGARPFGDTSDVVVAPMLKTPAKASNTEGPDPNWIVPMDLSDYIGIPPNVPNLEFSPYWHRAYNLIWNEWFRPEYICPAVPVAGVHEDGTVTEEQISDYKLLKRGKRLDAFTGCNPFPQVGNAVEIPLGGSAPVVGNGMNLGLTDGNKLTGLGVAGSDYLITGLPNAQMPKVGSGYTNNQIGTTYQLVGLTKDAANSGVVADLSSASAITINQLRNAFATQQYFEALARGGSRYIEILRSIFNVISPDARMQRPEYLGGSSNLVDVTTVAQTSSTDSTSPQGNLSAFCTVSAEGFFSKSFTEHCVIIGLANVRADLAYQQGLPRMFSRKTRFDWYLPQFANVGEVAVLNKELYAQGDKVLASDNTPVDDGVFGYQEAWYEYRYHPDMITGKFRSTDPQSLDYWHLAQKFDGLPKLDEDFVLESVPIDRCLAVRDEPAVILSGAFDSVWSRPMPLYSVPGLSRL